MTFINYKSMIDHTELMCKLIPKPDIVCAIPRSGLLPATLLALHWNVPLTTPHLLLKGESLGSGKRLVFKDNIKEVLVIDDSCNHGETISNVKTLLEPIKEHFNFKYAVIYAREKTKDLIDTFLGTLEQPRHFQWNWLHHKEFIERCCFDIDGVLCRPPTPEENDYGPNYEKFLVSTEPWFVPTVKIGAICTGRLERYRELTEKWLKDNNVEYNELIMRKESQPHPQSKIEYFKENDKFKIFVEDEMRQAMAIKKSCPEKAVLCTKGWNLV